MALKQRAAPPIPHHVLVDLQGQLSPQHGSVLWEGDGKKTLVARVPGSEPDLVADLDAIVENGDPAEVTSADRCLLIASRGLHQVPVEPLRQMMQTRVRFDAAQADHVRQALPRGIETLIYRSPADRRRRQRLGVRMPCVRVADVDDADLEELVEDLGPRLEKGYGDIHCVYLVADQDFVRLETGLFAQDLLSKYRDEDRRALLAAQRRQEQEKARRLREADRAALIHHLENKYPADVAYAPLRQHDETTRRDPSRSASRAGSHETSSHTRSDDTAPPSTRRHNGPVVTDDDPDHQRIRGRIDSLPSPRSVAMTDAEADGPPMAATVDAGRVTDPQVGDRRRARPSTGDDDMDHLAERLEAGGYELRIRPPIKQVAIDLAAERAEEYPQRVIASRHERLDSATARDLLQAARDLDVDLAIAVADAIDPEAQRLIVATKVKRIRTTDIGDLRL